MARLESVCTLTGYRGFESLSLRKVSQVIYHLAFSLEQAEACFNACAKVKDNEFQRNSGYFARSPHKRDHVSNPLGTNFATFLSFTDQNKYR